MTTQLKGFDFSRKEIETAIRNGKLLQASINLSRRCNFRCAYCLMDSGEPRENELNNEEIKRVLSEAKELGVKTWYIAGDGEPLMHEGIWDLVDYANSLDMWVILATNGEYLTEEKAKELKTKDLSVITKFNSFNPEIFNELIRTEATFIDYDGILIPRGVASLIETGYNAEKPTRAGIETVITTRNIHEIPEVYRFALQNNLFANIEMMLPIGRAVQHPELIPSEEQIRSLYRKLDKIKGSNGESMRTDPSHYESINCYNRLRYSLYINSAGDAFLCFSYAPELSTGMNVRDSSLKTIVEKRKFPKFFSGCACMYFGKR